jgi:hypothetical protein
MSHVTTMPRIRLPLAFDSVHISSSPVADATTDAHAIDSPLWVIVIGMACFFGVAALVIAWG